MEISKRIKQYRKAQNLTQKDLGKLLNVSDKTISSWETERTYPDLHMILIISETLNISLDNLLKGDQEIVKKISKDTKYLKKRILLGIIISFIFTLCLSYFFFSYQRGMIVSEQEEISNARVVSIGEDKVLKVDLKMPFYKKYKGYMIADKESEKEYNIILRTKFSLFTSESNTIEIPLNFQEDNKTKIKEINFVDKENNIIKTLFDIETKN